MHTSHYILLPVPGTELFVLVVKRNNDRSGMYVLDMGTFEDMKRAVTYLCYVYHEHASVRVYDTPDTNSPSKVRLFGPNDHHPNGVH